MSDVYKRNLAVPFFTQRDNSYIWQQISNEDKIDKNGNYLKKIGEPFGPKYPMAWRTCNITSLCMILHYWGLTKETPNQMIEKVFSKEDWGWSKESNDDAQHLGASRLESWDNLEIVANLYIEGKEGFSVIHGKKLSMTILETEIAKGCPVMISTGLGKYIKNNSYARDGHIVVVRGFTDDNDVILNDPFGIPVEIDNKIKPKTENDSLAGYYYNSSAAGVGDNIIIKRTDFEAVYAEGSSRYLYIEGPLWQEPGGKETDISNSYPIRADNMWHDGIHLESANGFYSIGSGRLIAARNAEVENHGSNSFALIKHQMPNQENKFFYTLYMHLKKVDIADELKTFMLTGKLSKAIEDTWYAQIFNNLLPNYMLINYQLPEDLKDCNSVNVQDYKKIYKAKINTINYKLSPTSELAELSNLDGNLSKHMKLYLLPSDGRLKILCEIENYSDFNKLSFMVKTSNANFKDSDGYYYFYCGTNDNRQLCCCKNEKIKIPSEGSSTEVNTFASYSIVNEPSYKLYSKFLYELYKGNTVIFDTIDTNTKNKEIEKLNYKLVINNSILSYNPTPTENSKFLLQLKSQRGGNTISIEHAYEWLKNDILKINEYLENLFLVNTYTGNSASKNDFEQLFKNYKAEREKQLSNILSKISLEIDKKLTTFSSIENRTDADWMEELFEAAEKIIKCEEKLGKRNDYNSSTGLINMRNLFLSVLDEFKKYDILSGIAICEYLMLEFVSIPKEKLSKETDRYKFQKFTKEKGTFNELKKKWDELFTELSNFYLTFLKKRYIDNYIEIPKGVKIGEGSKIPDSKKNNSIHFEIFSKEKLITGDSELKDDDDDNFYNPSEITNKIVSALNLSDKERSQYLKFAEDNVITKSEIEKLYTQTEFFQKMVTYHRSEWKNKKYTEQEISAITNKKTKMKGNNELIDTLDYYNDYYSKYNWDKNLEKELGTDKFYYYHPKFFIEKLSDSEKR